MLHLNPIRRTCLIAVPLLALVGGVSRAQVTPQAMPIAPAQDANANQPVQVRVHNVRADIVAYWLDPVNNPQLAPAAEGIRVRNKVPVPLPPVAVNLTAGPVRAVPMTETNMLLLSGTPAVVQQAQALISQLDKPLTQFEVQIQIIEMKATDLNRLGFPEDLMADETATVSFLGLPADFAAQLGYLSNTGQARILSAPRVMVGRGLPASMAVSGDITKGQVLFEHVVEAQAQVSEAPEEGMLAVTLDISGRDNPKTAGTGAEQTPSVETSVKTQAVLKDQGTLALVNLPKPIIAAPPEMPAGQIYVAFVTVRQIRPTNETRR
jgi:hypothetical protein